MCRFKVSKNEGNVGLKKLNNSNKYENRIQFDLTFVREWSLMFPVRLWPLLTLVIYPAISDSTFLDSSLPIFEFIPNYLFYST